MLSSANKLNSEEKAMTHLLLDLIETEHLNRYHSTVQLNCRSLIGVI